MDLKRTKSILTGGEVEELAVIKRFPIFTGGTDSDDDIFENLVFDICKESGIIQLRNLIDPDLLYSYFHSDALGYMWEKHRKLFVSIISKHINGYSVLEIGGSDSKLASEFIHSDIKKWTIIDPNIHRRLLDPRIEYIDDFFDKETEGFDVVVHSHVLEHIYNPLGFLKTISGSLKDGDYHIFSVPNLYFYLKNRFISAITFEHSLLLTEEVVDYLLSLSNFNIENKTYYEGHSIIYVTKKQTTIPLPVPSRYEEHKMLFLDFLYYYREFVDMANERMKGREVYLFGGHNFSQFLICLGLDVSKIRCVLDNSPLKIGKRLYGTNLMIRSPYDVNLNDSLVILKMTSYQDEIKSQLLSINHNVKFLE